jgi:hypothetical protein
MTKVKVFYRFNSNSVNKLMYVILRISSLLTAKSKVYIYRMSRATPQF